VFPQQSVVIVAHMRHEHVQAAAGGGRFAIMDNTQPLNRLRMSSHMRHFAMSLTLLLALAGSNAAIADDSTASASTGAWQFMRPHFYGDREIGEVDEKFMRVEAPLTTLDPAATPLTLYFGEGAPGTIKQVRLIIDHNPSPLAATIDLEQGVPIDEIDLRVRIDRATSVRAIAETNDGRLEMRSVWIDASGGCSAAPSAASGGKLGEIRFRPSPDAKSLQVSIRHPNHSGFQIDPLSGDAIPPHYVSHILLRAGDKTLLEADTGISISENPTIRIASDRALTTPVTIDAVDSQQAHFTATWNGSAANGGGL